MRSSRRQRHARSTRLVAAFAAGALLLAACGGDDDDDMDMDDDTSMDEETASGLPAGQFGPACDQIPADGPGSSEGMAEDPAATAASNNPVLSTLVELVGAVDLGDTINNLEGATIFAPSNGAFEDLQASDPDTFQAVADDPELLSTVLTYHVLGDQELDAQGLADAGSADTVAGQDLRFRADGDQLSVEAAGSTANVVCGNVATANATVHIIDTVLIPDVGGGDGGEAAALPTEQFGPACDLIPADGAGSSEGMAQDPAATAASNNPVLSTLVRLVGIADLGDTLNSLDGVTIFAPSNDAFDALAAADPETFEAVVGDVDLLTTVLTNHVIGDQELDAQGLADAGSAGTVAGQDLQFSASGDVLNVEAAGADADVVCGNVATANATVHIIDFVLVPDVG